MNEDVVSIIVRPTSNHIYISRFLNSLVNSKYKEIEIVTNYIDSACYDCGFPIIKYDYSQEKTWLSQAILNAKGDYVILVEEKFVFSFNTIKSLIENYSDEVFCIPRIISTQNVAESLDYTIGIYGKLLKRDFESFTNPDNLKRTLFNMMAAAKEVRFLDDAYIYL